MHSQKDTLKILNCSKATLSRYVADGKLNRVKKGRRTFYDEHEVASLVSEVEKNQKRVGVDIKPKEPIKLPLDVKKEFETRDVFKDLNSLGLEILATTTENLKKLGLYEESDKQLILLYSLSWQLFCYYGSSVMENDGITTSDTGVITIHSHFKLMQHHEKQMLYYNDRLGLNPLARQKLEIKKEEGKKESIFDLDTDFSDSEDIEI